VDVIPRDFRVADTRRARVILIEAGTRVLPAFHADSSARALTQLRELAVEVRLGAPVTRVLADGVELGGETAAQPQRHLDGGRARRAAHSWARCAARTRRPRAGLAGLLAPRAPETFVIGMRPTSSTPRAGGRCRACRRARCRWGAMSRA